MTAATRTGALHNTALADGMQGASGRAGPGWASPPAAGCRCLPCGVLPRRVSSGAEVGGPDPNGLLPQRTKRGLETATPGVRFVEAGELRLKGFAPSGAAIGSQPGRNV